MRLIDADSLIKELEEEAKSLEKEDFEIKEDAVLKSNLRGRADGIRDALIEIIDAPTVEQNRWIPCSERLPEIGEDVLVTVRLSNMNMWLTGNSDNCVVYVCYLSTDADGLCWISNDYKMVFKKNEVLAWMPLPNPYEEDKQC